MNQYKFKLELSGFGETPEAAWRHALAGYYYNELKEGKAEDPPPMPDYELIEEGIEPSSIIQ